MRYCIILIITILLTGCNLADAIANSSGNVNDTIPPGITLYGKLIDTAYLNTFYINPGAFCNDGSQYLGVQTSGVVNTRTTGTGYLFYDAKDLAGNNAATLTRTVHVVESEAAFLSGPYNVACKCTAVTAGSTASTVTANSYTASVMLSQTNNRFEIVQLKIGSEYVIPVASLNDNSISLLFYRNSDCISTGTVSPAKNTFTIETTETMDSPAIKYKCKNIYTTLLKGLPAKFNNH